ncbi:MAG TPA: hypothetical protein PLS66_03675 [Tepiditoga sp.]|nr:hypothetical protein [Tepiditoga sp.]
MIAYFSIFKSQDEKYSGGILTVNDKGLPENFKYTTPIKPNKIQKIIYGNNIKSYLAGEIIEKNFQEVFKDTDIIFVNDADINDYIKDSEKIIYISENYTGNDEYYKNDEALIKVMDNKGIKLSYNKEIGKDLYEKIKNFAEIFDITEPFDRLSEALNHICSSEEEQN